VKKLFAAPPREYSSAPLWVWNDMLTEEQVRSTLRDLAGQKVRQAFVHPRPGLMTPYLSDDWFRLWRAALDEAEKLDVNVWIYDENSYPSGFAGGWVPELMPESRGRGLAFREEKKIAKPGPEVVAVYRVTADGFENVTEKARSSASMPEDRYVVAFVVRAANSPWHGDRCYVDLMYPGVTEEFLEVTLDAYKSNIGDQFGKRVLGSFTDEPNVNPAGGLPWTDHLPAAFQKRWGYSLLDHLPSLIRPVGRWKQVRHDFFQVVLEQYIEHWAKPYYNWCEKNGIAFTGHYWDHEWPNCIGVPDNMAMNSYQHIPGIDCLMNQYAEHTHAQFGNVRMVKELSSVANQLGRKRRLCEIYGAGGWDLRFEDMKRIGDWLEVLGVNLLDEHLSYVTLRGARKADHPQSFSYHEPWWDSYHLMAEYFTRLTAAMCQGEQVNRVLVLEPTTTAWMYQADSTQGTHLGQIGKSFFDLVMSLERAQVEYDLGCEEVIARHGRSRNLTTADRQPGPNDLFVGNRRYNVVVLPPNMETLDASTVGWMENWVWHGGSVLCCGEPPALVDGRPSDRVKKLAQERGWQQVKPEELAEKLVPVLGRDGTAIRRAPDDKGILFHHRRRLADGELLLMVNTSIDAPSSGKIESQLKGAEVWDCRTGKIAPYPFTSEAGAIQLSFQLPPCGSLLLFLSEKPLEPGRAVVERATAVPPSGAISARRLEPNVLTLDYLDVTAGGETRTGLYFHAANQMAFQKNGMERNPWDSAVQFKDELISKKFPPQSGFEATYRFTIEGEVPKPLWIVIERPDLYTVACNGRPVKAAKDSWWLDRAFGKIDITEAARPGPNAVTIQAQPFTIYHEIEPAYVLGDFCLKATQSGFAIVPPGPIAVPEATTQGAKIEKLVDSSGPGRGGLGWNQQGMPFYAAGVAYQQAFDVPQPKGRYRVVVPSWYGSVAKVLVNGRLAGHLGWQPWECDVTECIQPGPNTIEVVVIGTLKNTLGPHHAGATRGTAWPGMFHQGPRQGPPPGAAYDTIGYGLFAPFALVQVTR
jgi:hypothetical protein